MAHTIATIQTKNMKQRVDLKKGEEKASSISISDVAVVESDSYSGKSRFWRWLSKLGVEVRGIENRLLLHVFDVNGHHLQLIAVRLISSS